MYTADILRIGNLNEFIGLVKLKLDNNIIERIENLDKLVNLKILGEFFFSSMLSVNRNAAIKLISEVRVKN